MPKSLKYFLVVIGLVSSVAKASSLMEQNPQTSQVTLSTGDVVRLPLQISKSSGIVLAGVADLDKLNQFLIPEGYQALPVTSDKGLVLIFAMNYVETSIGSYQELVIQVASTPSNRPVKPILNYVRDLSTLASSFIPLINHATNTAHENTPFFMWKLFVTSPLALAAGREIWGYPKDIGSVDVTASLQASSFSASFDGSEMLRAVRGGDSHFTMPLSIDMQMVSPTTYKQVLSHGKAQASAAFALFDAKKDSFVMNPNTTWGGNLAQIGFSPILWQIMPQFEAVFFPAE